MTTEAGETPASDLLRADHRKFEKHLDSLLDLLKHLSAERVVGVRREFVALQKLSQVHFEQEERVFYPAIRPAAPQVMVQMEQEHATVRETQQALDEMLAQLPETTLPDSPTQRELGELYRLGIEFHDALEVHIEDEEDLLLTVADEALSREEQQRLAAEMTRITEPLDPEL